MQRRTSTHPIRVWSFGCKKIISGGDLIRDQLHKSHVYYNKLIEIELEKRTKFRKARSDISPNLSRLEVEVQEIDKKISDARLSIKAKNAKLKKRVSPGEGEKSSIKQLISERRDLYQQLRVAREETKNSSELKIIAENLHEDSNNKVKQARGSSGVYFGTYLLIEKAFEASKSSATDPRFRRWNGCGRIGVQIQKRITVGDILAGKCTMLQIDPLPPGAHYLKNGKWKVATKDDIPSQSKTKVRIRVGSNPDRSPIWSEFLFYMHRPMPENAVVKWAWIKILKIGFRTEYSLQLTLESNEFLPKTPGKGIIALDLGWRHRENGIRIGYTVDSYGVKQEIVIPNNIQSNLNYCSELISVSDLHFNQARDILHNVIKTKSIELPDWIHEESKTIHMWRSHRKLAFIINKWNRESNFQSMLNHICSWNKERLLNKQDLLAPFSECALWITSRGENSPVTTLLFYFNLWMNKDRHLIQWASSQRIKTISRREHLFRNIASNLSLKYETLLLEDFDLRDFAKKEEAEDDKSSSTEILKFRSTAAPGEFRQALIYAFGKNRVKLIDPRNTTKICHFCNHKNDFEKPELLEQTCAQCGKIFDQDENACYNFLAMESGGNSDPGDIELPGVEGETNYSDDKQFLGDQSLSI